MIAQDKIRLENQLLVEEAHSLLDAKFITEDQFAIIKKLLPTPKRQKNILFRLGFLLLGMLLYSSICGFLTLFGLGVLDNNFEMFLFIFAAVGFIGAEFFARQNFLEHGLDDAFIIGGQLLLAGAIGTITNEFELVIAAVTTIVALLSYFRYINRASIIIFCFASTATIAYTMFEMGVVGKSILPFILMLYAIVCCFICAKITIKVQYPIYQKGLLLVKYYSLLLFYFSGNYLVVRELSVALLGHEITANADISFAWFFYIFTFIVPISYIFYGLKKLDRSFLWIGLLTFVFSLYSIDFYFLDIPAEIYLITVGLLLFAIAYFSIKMLKDKKEGITFRPDRFINSNDFLHTEALILTSQFGLKPEATIDSPMEFGGGGFSGGGSTGGY
jgi:hypothetical protein